MAINSYNNSSNGAALGNILKIVGTLGDLGIIKTPQAKQAEAQTQLAQQDAANKQTTFDQGQDQVTKFQDPTSKESALARQDKTIFLQSASKLSKDPEYQNAIKSLIDQTNGVKDEAGAYVVPPASAYQVKASDESPLAKLINAQVVAKMQGESSYAKALLDRDTKIAAKDKEKALTGDQYKAALFGQRMNQAEGIFGQLQEKGYDPTSLTADAQRSGYFPERFKSDEFKSLQQAQRNFLNAVLRRESGASISPSEQDSGNAQYFPQGGDSPEQLEQKRQNRLLAINGMRAEAGKAYDQVGFGGATAQQSRDYKEASGLGLNSANAAEGKPQKPMAHLSDEQVVKLYNAKFGKGKK